MDIGKTIRQARLRSGLSQQQISDAFGISRAAVSAWEKNAARPSIDRLVVLARMLDLPVNALLGDRSSTRTTDLRERVDSSDDLGAFCILAQCFAALDERDREALIEIAKSLVKSAENR